MEEDADSITDWPCVAKIIPEYTRALLDKAYKTAFPDADMPTW